MATLTVVIPNLVWDPGRTIQEPQRFGSFDIQTWFPACAGMTVVARSNCCAQHQCLLDFFDAAVGCFAQVFLRSRRAGWPGNPEHFTFPPSAFQAYPGTPAVGAKCQCLHKRFALELSSLDCRHEAFEVSAELLV